MYSTLIEVQLGVIYRCLEMYSQTQNMEHFCHLIFITDYLAEPCPWLTSMMRYFSRLIPMMLMNGHCVLLEKKCAQICNTPRPRCAGS